MAKSRVTGSICDAETVASGTRMNDDAFRRLRDALGLPVTYLLRQRNSVPLKGFKVAIANVISFPSGNDRSAIMAAKM